MNIWKMVKEMNRNMVQQGVKTALYNDVSSEDEVHLVPSTSISRQCSLIQSGLNNSFNTEE
jgi:hypothetical protein